MNEETQRKSTNCELVPPWHFLRTTVRGAKRWKKWKFAPTLRAVLHPFFFVNPRPSLFPSTIDASLSFLLSISFNIRSIFSIFFLDDCHLRHVWLQVSSLRIRLMSYSMFTFYLSLILSWYHHGWSANHCIISYSTRERVHHLLITFLKKYNIIAIIRHDFTIKDIWTFKNQVQNFRTSDFSKWDFVNDIFYTYNVRAFYT